MTLFFELNENIEGFNDDTDLESDLQSNSDVVSSDSIDVLENSSEDSSETPVSNDVYYEEVIAELKVMNELTAKVYTCNIIILSLIVFFFFYRLIKNNITRHFT